MMTLFQFVGAGWYEIVSPTHALSNHDIRIGGHRQFWRAISISKMACFWSNLHYIAHSSTRGFSTLTRAHGLMKGQEWLKLMEIVNYDIRNPNHVNILNFDLFRAHNARTRKDGNFWNAQNDLKTCSPQTVQKVILSIFLFWRARTGAWMYQYVDPWPEVMCIEFDQFMINGYEDMNDKVKSQNGA